MTFALTTLGLIGTTLALGSAVSLVMAWRGATEGYEDENGFHAGRHPKHRAINTAIELNRSANARTVKAIVSKK